MCSISVPEGGGVGLAALSAARVGSGASAAGGPPQPRAAVTLGPGDDAAVLAAPDGRVVASTDLLVDGRHFRREGSTGYDIGRKAAAQSLAHIAAMGAGPARLLIALPSG